jgi:phospholipid transport system substrate-binding protein
MKRFAIFAIVLLWFGGGFAADDSASTLVRNTSQRMLSALESHRAEIDRDPARLYSLIDAIVVPHFDFERITESAMGRFWRRATPEQRSELTRQFQELLIRTYAKALLAYSGQKIRYLPVRPGGSSNVVTVATQVQEAGSPPVAIDYSLHRRNGDWKVYDIAIDHVSLVANYRSSFASQIREGGIDGLIRRLREMNTKKGRA